MSLPLRWIVCDRSPQKNGGSVPAKDNPDSGPKSQKARYLPGHDARHHAALKAGGKRVTFITPAQKREIARETNRARRAGKAPSAEPHGRTMRGTDT